MRNLLSLPLALLLVVMLPIKVRAAGEHCGSAYQSNTHVVTITDPSGQQTAQFDLARGSILTSLQYLGVEYISAPTNNSGGQIILRATNYTPTMGGNSGGRGSVSTGVACSQNHLWLTSGMTDDANNANVSTAYVFNGSQWFFDQLIGTYVVSTYAYFVPNPYGSPAYYLKIDRTVTNIDSNTDIDPQENFPFTLDILTSVPTQFASSVQSPSCPSWAPCSNSTSYIVTGLYAPGFGSGVAVAVFPSTHWTGQPGASYITTETLSGRNVFHINRTQWYVQPQSYNTYSQYIMVGSWANASSFASNVCNYSVSAPPADTYPQGGGSGAVTITTNGACRWEAFSDSPWLSVSPASGTGSGTVTYSILANTSGIVRRGNIHVAGRVFPFFQQK